MTMKDTITPPGTMTLERLRMLVNAYGARAERWPDAERDAACAFVTHNAAARALVDAAAELDVMLDLAGTVAPAPDLSQRIAAHVSLRHAPRRHIHPVHRWIAAAAVPLAAAAALVLWLTWHDEVTSPVSPQYAVEDLGTYTTPTDLLLSPPGFDLAHTLPDIGCSDNGLGCPEIPILDDRDSSLRIGGGSSV